MKKKLKIYSALLIVTLLVLTTKFVTFSHNSWTSREGEELYIDSLDEYFTTKLEKKTRTWNDTINGTPVTQSSTDFSWSTKKTFEVGLPVRHRGSIDHYLYSRLANGQPVMVDIKDVKIKVPMEFSQQNEPFVISLALVFLIVPFYIWLLVVIMKVLWSVYKGEVFVSEIAKGLEKAGKLLVAIWIVGRIIGYIVLVIMKQNLLLAGYEIDFPIIGEVTFLIFGLALMIVSQIILMGKELQEEQDLTI